MEHTTYFAYVAKNMLQITLSRQLNHLGTYFFFHNLGLPFSSRRFSKL